MKSLVQFIKESKDPEFDNENIQALYDYAYGYTNDLNYHFRKGKPKKQDKENASKISKLAKPMKLPVLYRSAEWRHFKQDYGIDQNNVFDKIGEVIEDPGFLSTSTAEEGAWQLNVKDKDNLLIVFKSKGQHKAININDELGEYSPSPEQTEILLDQYTKFKITNVDKDKKGVITITAEIV